MFLMSATSTEKWNEYLVAQYNEAFPLLPLLENSKQDSRKIGSAKKQSGRKVQSGTTPKQIVKNFDLLFNKLDKILELRIFGGLQAVVKELEKEESLAMKYSIILNKLVRQVTGICSSLYQERCDGKFGRSEKMGSFGISLLLEHSQGTAVGPLLTTQEQAKVNQDLQQAAGSNTGTNSKDASSGEDSDSSESDGKGGGDKKPARRRSRRNELKEEERRVIKTEDDDYIVYLPDAVMKLLNLASREVDGVIDLTNWNPFLFMFCPLTNTLLTLKTNPDITIEYLLRVTVHTCYLPMPIGKSLLLNASSASRLNKRRPFDKLFRFSFYPTTPAPPSTISLDLPPTVTPSVTTSDEPPTPIVAPGTPFAPPRVLRIRNTKNQYSAHRKAVSKRKIRAQRSPAAHERELESQRNECDSCVPPQQDQKEKRVYGPEELSTIDSLLGFGLQSSQEAIYIKCAERLSFNCMTKHCCVSCDCDYVKSELKYRSIGSEYRSIWIYFFANKLHNPVILILALCPDYFTATRPGKMDGDAGEELEVKKKKKKTKKQGRPNKKPDTLHKTVCLTYSNSLSTPPRLLGKQRVISSDAAVPEENTSPLPTPNEAPDPPATTSIQDYAVFRSTNLSKARKLLHIGLFFPTLLPFGEGVFGRHWGFTAIAYDYTALEQSFSQQYLTMRVRASAISDGKWTKEDIQKCYNHSRQMEECLKRGVTLPEAPPEVKQLIDIKKAILPGLRAFVGSIEFRQAGLHTAFGLQRRLGVANIYATISPATSRSWAVAINCDLVNGEHCQLKFLVGDGELAMPGTDGIILPNNNVRASAASANLYECADYARRVLN
ncbi:hypothetical protein BDR26DRAFT_973528, partial [Obelidium mucronatum]